MRAKLVFLGGCILLLPVYTVLAGPLGVNQLVVFGDSLSDVGNAAIGTGGILPGPATNYAPGEFTDGPVTVPSTSGPTGIWVDQIAPKLGVAGAGPSFTGGTDFAVGGAQTGTNPNFPGVLQAPYVDQQVQLFLTGGKVSSTALYAFWAGANDIDNNPLTPGIGTQAADNIYKNILSLSGAGAKYFLWFNLPLLGQTPDALGQGPQAVAIGNADSLAFDAEWQLDMAKLLNQGIYVVGVDTEALFVKILADNAAGCKTGAADPFCFANVTQGAQGKIGVDPNTYLFWDGEHPTTTGQALVANAALAAIVDSPEPSSAALAILGFAGAALLAYRSRANSN